MTVPFFFSGIKVGYPHYGIFNPLSLPSWERSFGYFFYMDSCLVPYVTPTETYYNSLCPGYKALWIP